MAMDKRIVNLDINTSGAWRRVCSFDLDTFQDGDLEHCAHSLLELSSCHKLKARLISPEDTAPLMTWSKEEGWLEWRAAV